MKNFIITTAVILLVCSCKKDPGVGGDAEILGQVWTRDYNTSMTTLIGEYPAADEYVYIVYGDHKGFDKRIKTDYNGFFRFQYLYPGNYTIYAYSADTTLQELDGQLVVIKQVELKEKKSSEDIGKLIIAK